jgi:hypothetical protein
MPANVIVWDIETVPDIKSFAAANGHDGKSYDEIRAAMGDKFPKHIYHSMICIGALIAHEEEGRWVVDPWEHRMLVSALCDDRRARMEFAARQAPCDA